MMDRVLDVARSHNAGERATLALIVACIQESLFSRISPGDLDSEGILQYRRKYYGDRIRDVEWCVRASSRRALREPAERSCLARKHPEWSPARDRATAPQQNANVNDPAVQPYIGELTRSGRRRRERTLRAYGGVGTGGTTVTTTKRYEFARGRNESTWDASGRLVEDVGLASIHARSRQRTPTGLVSRSGCSPARRADADRAGRGVD